jgi:hypothetical protein
MITSPFPSISATSRPISIKLGINIMSLEVISGPNIGQNRGITRIEPFHGCLQSIQVKALKWATHYASMSHVISDS